MDVNEKKMSTAGAFRNFFLDAIFPPTCIGCESLIPVTEYAGRNDRPGLCAACKDKIAIQNSFACAFCQAAVINGMTCPFCRKDHDLTQLLVTANYGQPLVQKVIKNFKYRFMKGLGEDMADLMSQYLKKQIHNNVINIDDLVVVPTPLTTKRLRWRGFNQSEVLAGTVCKNFGLEMIEALKRNGNQRPQAEITNREERIANIGNVFTCDSELILGKNILLIDDVSTTGTTLEACAKTLKSSGALKITAFVFARG